MKESGVSPNKITFIHILAACCNRDMFPIGEWLHTLILDLDLEMDISVSNALISMYGKCGTLALMSDFFYSMPSHNIISWNTVISTFSQNGKSEESLTQIKQMECEGFIPDKVTFVLVISMCARLKLIDIGKEMHLSILSENLEGDVAVSNALINMYSKCDDLQNAWKIYDNMPIRDSFTYNSMIEMFSNKKNGKKAYQVFVQLMQEVEIPYKVTLLHMLSACNSPNMLAIGKQLHTYVNSYGLYSDTMIGNALLDMYGICGSWKDTKEIFATIPMLDKVSWNLMIKISTSHGYHNVALQMFSQMQMEGEIPDKVTFLNTLAACSHTEGLQSGKQIHARICKCAFSLELCIRNGLISMYGKSDSLKAAEGLFLESSDIGNENIPWNVMIAMNSQNGQYTGALALFEQMQQQGEIANLQTLVSSLSACSSQSAIAVGKRFHVQVEHSGFQKELAVGNALINMYGKCGNISIAEMVFERMQEKDVITWTTMIAIYSQHGQVQNAISSFHEMQQSGELPNRVTVLNVLNGCSHAGIVECCIQLLVSNVNAFEIPDHFVAMVDLLGRAGQLDEAEEIINIMPFESSVVEYIALLASCRYQADIDRGKDAAIKVLELDPRNAVAPLIVSKSLLGNQRCTTP